MRHPLADAARVLGPLWVVVLLLTASLLTPEQLEQARRDAR